MTARSSITGGPVDGRALILAESGVDPEQAKDAGFRKRVSDIVPRLDAPRAGAPELVLDNEDAN